MVFQPPQEMSKVSALEAVSIEEVNGSFGTGNDTKRLEAAWKSPMGPQSTLGGQSPRARRAGVYQLILQQTVVYTLLRTARGWPRPSPSKATNHRTKICWRARRLFVKKRRH
jgi:hypothetical protein